MPTEQEVENLARILRRQERGNGIRKTAGDIEATRHAYEGEDEGWRDYVDEARRILNG